MKCGVKSSEKSEIINWEGPMKLKKLLQLYASAARNDGRVKNLSDIKGTLRRGSSKDFGVNNSQLKKHNGDTPS